MAKMTKIWGIRAQLITALVILTMAAIGFIGVMSQRVIEQTGLMSKVGEAELLIDTMKFISEDGVEALWSYVQDNVRKGRINRIVISDKNGKTLYQKGAMPEDQRGRTIRYVKGAYIKLIGSRFFSIYGANLLVSATMIDGGNIRLIIPLNDVKNESRGIKKVILYSSIIYLIIIVFVGTYLLSKLVIKPIRKLESTARRIADGSIEERAKVGDYNEIENLARSFNEMAEGMEEKIKSLKMVNSELLSAQERLLVSEKLATVGSLAAGIAHEIGNPLGAVIGYLDILIKGDTDKDEEQEILKRIQKETIRINRIVREFLDLSRPSKRDTEETAPLNVTEAIKDAVNIFEPQRMGGKISVDIRLNETLPSVMVAENRLKQVILNLLMNARDSMPEGGVITVKANQIDYNPGEIHPARRRGDPLSSDFKKTRDGTLKKAVSIAISDTGKGIGKEDIGKIFDPFFTTKDIGKGTGLGLFVSQGIIRAYGGEIRASSHFDKGTTFEVILPALA